LSGRLEDVEKTLDVALDVGVRVRQRVAHPRLGGQADYPIKLLGSKERAQAGFVGQVHSDKAQIGPG